MKGRAPLRTVRALAPAKINPFLAVLGRRPDGYHELETWLVAIDLCDRIVACEALDEGIRIRVDGPFASADIGSDRTNLCVRAAELVLEAARRRGARVVGVELALEKGIPSRSGLGGASSDAAAAWLATREIVVPDLPLALGVEALATLGSDCAFFLAAASGHAVCTGRGERVATISAPPPAWSIALVTPNSGCATSAVYARLLPSSEPVPRVRPEGARNASHARTSLFNALEPAALAVEPELVAWRALLDDRGFEHFRLSGSGSSFYGVFDHDADADRALEEIRSAARARGLSWRLARRCRTVGHVARLEN